MTNPENAALYSARTLFPTGSLAIARLSTARDRFRSSPNIARDILWLLIGIFVLAGCTPQTKPAEPSTAAEAGKPARAAVPLRVWFVGNEASKAIIQRQWQAASERPVDLRMLSSDELLKADKCACDVVVYPAHRIGDLIARNWLVELPGNLTPGSFAASASTPSGSASEKSSAGSAAGQSAAGQSEKRGDQVATATVDEETSKVQPAAWIDQTRYGRNLWGLSLGATAPVVMANFQFGGTARDAGQEQSAEDAKTFWQSVIEVLSQRTSGKPSDHSALAAADRGAVCDRFLVLVTSMRQRESRLGSLLDPETLKARLAEQEFVDAAEVMLKLHRLNAAPEAMAGSYQAAWNALSGDEPALSIGLPPPPTPEVDKVTSITARVPPSSRGASATRGVSGEQTTGWNSGHGLVASLTTQCRQTSLAIEFMRWLGSESNRNVLARSIDGVSAPSVYAPGSSAWQVQRLSQRIVQQTRLPNQPRLPGSAEYRQTLGEQLVRMLSGELEPEAAMKAAAAAWDEITAKRDQGDLRSSYEASLGL